MVSNTAWVNAWANKIKGAVKMAMTKKQHELMDAHNALYEAAIRERQDLIEKYMHDELFPFESYKRGIIKIDERIKTLKETSSLILNSL